MKNQQAGTAQTSVRAPITLSKGVIAFLIIIIAVVAVAAVLLLRGGGGAGGLPVYSGASEFNSTESDVTGGHLTSTYYDLGTANLADVYSWYKTEMPKQGWTLAGDNPQSGAYTLNYTKGNDSAEIVIVQGTIEGYSANKILVLAYTAATQSGTAPC